MADEMMTLAEAASKLTPPVSPQALDYHRKKGHITTKKSGRIHLVSLEQIQQELEKHAKAHEGKKYKRKIIGTTEEVQPPTEAPPSAAPPSKEEEFSTSEPV